MLASAGPSCARTGSRRTSARVPGCPGSLRHPGPAHRRRARLLTGILVAIGDGSAAALHDGVERALRPAPRAFEDFVTETAAAGHGN
jgi:hypothetical protein